MTDPYEWAKIIALLLSLYVAGWAIIIIIGILYWPGPAAMREGLRRARREGRTTTEWNRDDR